MNSYHAIIHQNIAKLAECSQRYKTAVKASEINKYKNEFDENVRQTNLIIKQNVDLLRKQNDSYQFEKFKDTVSYYYEKTREYSKIISDREKRELKIVVPDITLEQTKYIIDNGLSQQIIDQLDDTPSVQLDEIISSIEQRHSSIIHLEQTIVELKSLFDDMAVLVDIHQDILNNVEIKVENTLDLTNDSNKHLKSAEKYQNKSRKLTCCVLLVILVLLAVILTPILVFKQA
jgi:hypothetical protein